MPKLYEVEIEVCVFKGKHAVRTTPSMKLVKVIEDKSISKEELENVFLGYSFFSRNVKKHARYQFKEFFTIDEIRTLREKFVKNSWRGKILAKVIKTPIHENKVFSFLGFTSLDKFGYEFFFQTPDVALPGMIGFFAK